LISFGGQNSTFLIITAGQAMRADVRGDQVVKLTREPRPVGTTLPIAVELACGLTGKKPAQKTYVIADDFWTGVIDLDERSIYGLEGDELEQMLRFETESLSDLDPLNSRLGFVELSPVPPDTRRFWGAAVPSEVLSGVAQAVRVRGGKLEMLANPIGMSSPDRSGVPWVEFTPELAGAFAAPAESGGFPRAYVTRRSSTSDRWYEALRSLFGGTLPDMGWQTTPADRPPLYPGTLESLSDEPVLERWIQGLVARVATPAGFPHVPSPQIPTSGKTLFRIGTAAALVMALVCGSLAWTMHTRTLDMQADIDQLEAPRTNKDQLDKEIEKLKEEAEELRAAADEATSRRDNLRLLMDQGDRFAVLLKSLADQANPNLVVDAITPKSNGMTLSGSSIRSDAVTQLVQKLEPILAPVGWSVRPASAKGSNQTAAGGPWTFTIQLVDQQPIVPAVSSQSKAAAASLREPSLTSADREGND
jgi:Tfp pilus assembly protein PilN